MQFASSKQAGGFEFSGYLQECEKGFNRGSVLEVYIRFSRNLMSSRNVMIQVCLDHHGAGYCR